MPFVLLIIGVTLLVAAGQNTQDKLFALVQNDFASRPSFLPWAVALLIIGLLGYIDAIKSVMRAFLILVILGILLSNRGFFALLTAALKPYSGAGTK
jgi:hypothetical protein